PGVRRERRPGDWFSPLHPRPVLAGAIEQERIHCVSSLGAWWGGEGARRRGSRCPRWPGGDSAARRIVVSDTRILPATTAGQIEQVRALFREYAQETGHCECFQGFVEEIAGLPGPY